MSEETRAKKAQSKADDRREADARRDILFFAERKAREATNQEKIRRLREQRLAHEAASPKAPVAAPRRTKKISEH